MTAYNAPFGSSDANAPYVDGDATTGLPGSIVPAHAIEFPQREIINVILAAGITPSNAVLTQLRDAINSLIATAVAAGGGGGGGGGGGAFLPLAGGTMVDGASVAFSGAGGITHNGHPFWNGDNDGAGSGMDTDLVQGVNGTKLMRNDRDTESAVNDAIRFLRQTVGTGVTRGVVQAKGKTGLSGGASFQMLTGDGATVSCELLLSDDRRSLAVRMFSDNGTVFEDQIRILDAGDIWLRKLNANIGDSLGFGEHKTATVTNTTTASVDFSVGSYVAFWIYASGLGPSSGAGAYNFVPTYGGTVTNASYEALVGSNGASMSFGIGVDRVGLNTWIARTPLVEQDSVSGVYDYCSPTTGDVVHGSSSGVGYGYRQDAVMFKADTISLRAYVSGNLPVGARVDIFGIKRGF